VRLFLVLLIMAGNCGALFFASFLAAGGDGSSDGVEKVLTFGAVWILLATLIALILLAMRRGAASILVAILTLPSAWVFALVCIFVGDASSRAKPSSSEFIALCKTAGITMGTAPAWPVESVAYTWDDPYPPKFSYFTLDEIGNVGQLAAGLNYRVPHDIDFTETRSESSSRDGARRFKQHGRDGTTTWVPDFTADALVTYKSTPIEAAGLEPDTWQYEITVSDRRDGRRLASLRYFLNEKHRRGCGTTSDGVMSEVDFVSRAIGLK
jgi:hypothetical protein